MNKQEAVEKLINLSNSRSRTFNVDTYQGKRVWTNGIILEIARKFPHQIEQKIKGQKSRTGLIPLFMNLNRSWRREWSVAIICPATDDNEHSEAKHVSLDIGVYFDPILHNYAKVRYPRGTYYIKDETSPIIVTHNDKFALAIMPLRDEVVD